MLPEHVGLVCLQNFNAQMSTLCIKIIEEPRTKDSRKKTSRDQPPKTVIENN